MVRAWNRLEDKGLNRKVYDLYLLGYGYGEIAKQVNTDPCVPKRILNEQGIELRSVDKYGWTTKWTLDLEREAYRLYKKYGYEKASKRIGCTVYELAYLFWCSRYKAVYPSEFNNRTRKVFVTHSLVDRLKRKKNEGMTYRQLELRYKLAFIMVRKCLQQAGEYKERYEFTRSYRSKAKQVLSMYRKGYPLRGISDELRVKTWEVYEVLKEAGVKTREKHRRRTPNKHKFNMRLWHDYNRKCRLRTERVYRRHKEQLDPKGHRGVDYHLDHIYSVHQGFKNQVDYRMITHPANLRMISSSRNLSKASSCSQSLRSLQVRIERYQSCFTN